VFWFKGVFDKHLLKMGFCQTKPKKILKNILFFLHMTKQNPKVI
jgi:hypothetical protein